MITTAEALNRLIAGNELFADEMTDLMRAVMRGEMQPEVLAALLIGLRIKVETVGEITAAVRVLQEMALKVPVAHPEQLIDIVGTGGDGIKTFNISTTAMFAAAAAGVKVAKHGGRAVSSASGAADVMAAMGVNMNLTPVQIAAAINELGIGFMHAPTHNPAMRQVAAVRAALGVRTLFNILGPLTNPAGAKNQLLGVFHPDLLGICANVGKETGLRNMLVVHGEDGMDEITVFAPTKIAELRAGKISYFTVSPEDFGLPLHHDIASVRALSAAESLATMDRVLQGEAGAARDIVLLNTAAALYCAEAVPSIGDGVARARIAIDSGKAYQKKKEFIAFTNNLMKI